MLYRKRPVTVEALQFTGDNTTQMGAFTGFSWFRPADQNDHGDDPGIVAEVFDKLHSTWVGVRVGDWIIKGISGEFYPCADDVFHATYERLVG